MFLAKIDFCYFFGMNPKLIENIKELLKAAEPFCEWKAYPESTRLTKAVKTAKEAFYKEEN